MDISITLEPSSSVFVQSSGGGQQVIAMKRSYAVHAAMALSILLIASTIGYLQTRAVPPVKSVRTEAHATERQRLERQRGAVGTAAIAGTTAQEAWA